MNLDYNLKNRQVEQLHKLYQGESWSKGRTLEETHSAVVGSTFCIAITDAADNLAGFTRVLSDGIFKALVFDVIVAPAYRGSGIGKQLIVAALQHPALASVRHIELYCRPELEPFYEQYGFSASVDGMRLMRRARTA